MLDWLRSLFIRDWAVIWPDGKRCYFDTEAQAEHCAQYQAIYSTEGMMAIERREKQFVLHVVNA